MPDKLTTIKGINNDSLNIISTDSITGEGLDGLILDIKSKYNLSSIFLGLDEIIKLRDELNTRYFLIQNNGINIKINRKV